MPHTERKQKRIDSLEDLTNKIQALPPDVQGEVAFISSYLEVCGTSLGDLSRIFKKMKRKDPLDCPLEEFLEDNQLNHEEFKEMFEDNEQIIPEMIFEFQKPAAKQS